MIKNKIRVSISTKLTAMTVLLMIIVALPLTWSSMRVFQASSRQVAEENLLSSAGQKTREIESLLLNYMEKARVVGSFLLKESAETPLEVRNAMDAVMSLDADLIAVEIYSIEQGKPILMRRKAKEDRFRAIGTDSAVIDKWKMQSGAPLPKLAQGQYLVYQLGQPPLQLLMVGAPLSRSAGGQIETFVAAYIDQGKVQGLLEPMGHGSVFVADAGGRLIAHSDEKLNSDPDAVKTHPSLQRSLREESPRRQFRYESGSGALISSYVKSSVGLVLVSELAERQFEIPSLLVRRDAIYLVGWILSVALLVIVVFSVSLTDPISILAQIATAIGSGNFNVSARKVIKVRDEVGDLADALDGMVSGLKERDKVKQLFGKFHGSSVAEDILKRDVVMGGMSKEVVVFFSDIRGFTAFSETQAPEAVVEMLNEYFEVMVEIITRHGGIVDKFIGDAIMAVWGAPTGTPADRANSVRACIEMRSALARLNEARLARGQNALMIGIGLHAGRVVSGTIGSSQKLEYTVIGDTVNLASRIEASTKAYGVDLLVTGAVAESVDAEFWLESLGSIQAKGKTEPIKVFKVRGYVEQQSGKRVEVKTPYSDYEAEAADKIKKVG